MDEFVKRLAAVTCSDWDHPAPFRVDDPISVVHGISSPSWGIEKQKQMKAELAARCPFCIARALVARDAGSGLEQMLQEARNSLASWPHSTCLKCGKKAYMAREMTTIEPKEAVDGVTGSVLIEWKPAEKDWHYWTGSGPRGVHCPDCHKAAVKNA